MGKAVAGPGAWKALPEHLRADTHADNKIMQHFCWKRTGFTRLRCHPCGRRLAPQLCLPRSLPPTQAAGFETGIHPPRAPVLRMQSLLMPGLRTQGLFCLPPPRNRPCAASTVTPREENKAAKMAKTCPHANNTDQTENPHGHRPECKFVERKMSENALIISRPLCAINNTRPGVREQEGCTAIGVQ